MSTQQIAIAKQVTSLEKRINGFFSKLDMSNPMSVMANTEEIIKMQNEYQQIATLKHFLQVIEAGENVPQRISSLGNSIIAQRINNSTCLATNAIESYKFDGKREAYLFLVETFKSVK